MDLDIKNLINRNKMQEEIIEIYIDPEQGIKEKYMFLGWIGVGEGVTAIVSELKSGKIKQFELNKYTMRFVITGKKAPIDVTSEPIN